VKSGSGLAENRGSNAGVAYAALLLAVWAVPSAASSGIQVDCDQTGSAAHEQPTTGIDLNVKYVDHGVTKAGIGKNDISDDPQATRNLPLKNLPLNSAEIDSLDLMPRAEAMIQQVFDKNRSSQRSNSDLVNSDLVQIESSKMKPLASNDATSGAVNDNSVKRSESITTNVDQGINQIEMRLPGISDAELLRFRRQMYRTDI
jgi:hypothetical protein